MTIDTDVNLLRKHLRGLENDVSDEISVIRKNTQQPFFFRVIVEDIIFDPVALTDSELTELALKVKNAKDIEVLPRNAIIGKKFQKKDEIDSRPEIFYPFFSSHMLLPVKPGEQVWCFYEGFPAAKLDKGFWVSRVHERRDVEDTNYTHSDRRFLTVPQPPDTAERAGVDRINDEAPRLSFPNGLNTRDTATLSSENEYSPIESAYDQLVADATANNFFVATSVPRYTSRPGDLTLQGSHNQLINLGTSKGPINQENVDPLDSIDSVTSFGEIDIVVGRGQGSATAQPEDINTRGDFETNKSFLPENKNEGHPDYASDKARIYISENMSVDLDFNIIVPQGSVEVLNTVEQKIAAESGALVNSSDPDQSAAVVKADQVRLVARNDIKIVLADPDDPDGERSSAISLLKNGDIVITPGKTGVLKLGGEDADRAILMTSLPAIVDSGNITAIPILTTMGGLVGSQGNKSQTQGAFSTKVLIK